MNVEPTGPRGAAPEPVRAGGAADGSTPPAGTHVSLSIEQAEPLVGTATCAWGAPVPFVGWLELLRAVSDLVGAEGHRGDGGPCTGGPLHTE